MKSSGCAINVAALELQAVSLINSPLLLLEGADHVQVGFRATMRHPRYVTTEAMAPIGATPFAGLVPRLASLWRGLRAAVERRAATNEEKQVLLLIEFAAARFGDPLLRSRSVDHLDDQLDQLTGSSEALHWTVLLAHHVPMFQRSEAISATQLAQSVGKSLGQAQGRILSDEQQVLDAWLDAQQQASALIAIQEPVDTERIFEFSLASPEIPAELAQLMFHSLRAGFCTLAIVRVIATEEQVEPWLARALTERLVASAKEHLRLLASLPGVTVDESLVPMTARLDFEEIAAHHQRARSASNRSLEQTRTRLGL